MWAGYVTTAACAAIALQTQDEFEARWLIRGTERQIQKTRTRGTAATKSDRCGRVRETNQA